MMLGNIVNYVRKAHRRQGLTVGISEQVEVDDSFPSAYAFFIRTFLMNGKKVFLS